MKRALIACAALYGVIAIATFGHAAASGERRDDAEYAECRQRQIADDRIICLRGAGAPLGGLFAAVVWPFYWSWEAWS